MRNLYIVLSILCFALSGIITFKALNLPEKKSLNLEALSQVKSHKFSLVVKDILTEPAIEQAPLNLPVETLQNTDSQLEQKLANESAASQINIPVLPDTAKQLKKNLQSKIMPHKQLFSQLKTQLLNRSTHLRPSKMSLKVN